MNSTTKLTHPNYPGWTFLIKSPDLEWKELNDTLNKILHLFIKLCFERND